MNGTTPPVFGEVFEDGQFRGSTPDPMAFTKGAITFKEYALWDVDADKVGITNLITGEAGVFDKADFEAHVSAFLGLNF